MIDSMRPPQSCCLPKITLHRHWLQSLLHRPKANPEATVFIPLQLGADDGPAHLIFLIAAPATGESAHLEILAALARKIMDEEFRKELLAETSAESIAQIVNREVQK